MNLQLSRKSRPARRAHRIAIGIDLRARAAARQLREQRAVEQARAEHAAWLARASSRPPDLARLEALRIAAEAEAKGRQLRREIHALALEERLHPEVLAVHAPLRSPLRPPIRTPEPEPTRIEYSPATALWLARRNSR
jgi:hypothetical protein